MPPRRKYSPLWMHFKQTTSKKAKCNYCLREIAISQSSIGTLGRHLRKIHPTVNIKNAMEDTLTANSDSEESTTLDPDSELWGFFDKEPRNKAKCSMCGDVINRDADALYRHLKQEHSKVSENLEFKDNEENYTEIIYLENPEEEPLNKKERNETKVLSEVQSTAKSHKRRYSHKEKPRCTKTDKDDEVENFGKYVTALLKGIPTEECSQLQLEIVNLIMTVKIKVMEERTTDSDKDKLIEERDENMDQSQEYESNCTKDPITDEVKFEIKTRSVVISQSETTTHQSETPRHSTHPHTLEKHTAEEEEKTVDNFGKYIISLLKVVHREASVKLQKEIVNLIIVTRLKFLQKPKIVSIQNDLQLQAVA